MAKPKPEEPKKGAPEYMNTYGDLVTLLLCFFVLLFAMSTVDAKKFDEMMASFAGNPMSMRTSGGQDTIKELMGSGVMQMPSVAQKKDATENTVQKQAQDELKQMASDFKTYFAENNMDDKVQVEMQNNEVTITFKDNVLFDVGKAQLKNDALPAMDALGSELSKYPDNEILVEGHSDSDPINTPQYPSNWYLSSARAIAVSTFLAEQNGISNARLAAIGRGEFVPIAPNDSAENKAKNRRVEIRIKSKYYSGDELTSDDKGEN